MPKSIRVIACGGREFDDEARVWRGLEYVQSIYGRIDCLAHGGASGADSLAGEWAAANHTKISIYPARWKAEGKKAGPRRNQRMLDEFKPDYVVAFDGGKGTADMCRRAEASGVPVVRL